MQISKKYPVETVGGFFYLTEELERLRIEIKTYNKGNQAYRILLKDGRIAKLRKLDDDTLKSRIGPAFKEIKRQACYPLSFNRMDSMSEAKAGTVYVAVSTEFDGQPLNIEQIMDLPATDWLSLRAATAMLYR